MKTCNICNKKKKNISFRYTGDKQDIFCGRCKTEKEHLTLTTKNISYKVSSKK